MSPRRDERERARDGDTTIQAGLQGIAYVVAMAAVVMLVGFLLALLVSWVY